jgi:nucleotide-binding universal stress UspA family protein
MSADLEGSVLVACDFSEASEKAVAWAAQLQQRLVGGVKVYLLNLWAVPPVLAAAVPLPPMGPTDGDIKGIAGELEAVARRHGLEAEILVQVSPDPGVAIVQAADNLGCHLIVMGTHGRGAVARAVVGSAADWVVRKAPCPVVVTRAG